MAKKSKKRTLPDINELAKMIADQATAAPTKNPAAVMLGRLGGLKGGKARAEALSATKRREIAHRAAMSRWSKTK